MRTSNLVLRFHQPLGDEVVLEKHGSAILLAAPCLWPRSRTAILTVREIAVLTTSHAWRGRVAQQIGPSSSQLARTGGSAQGEVGGAGKGRASGLSAKKSSASLCPAEYAAVGEELAALSTPSALRRPLRSRCTRARAFRNNCASCSACSQGRSGRGEVCKPQQVYERKRRRIPPSHATFHGVRA